MKEQGMQGNPSAAPIDERDALKLQDYGELLARYQALKLAERANTALRDADPALQAADKILASIAAHAKSRVVFEGLRNNYALTGKMRPSEAKAILMDANNDFIEVARHKLAAWRKTMERLGKGEGIVEENGREYIPGHMPVAGAIVGISATSSYLSIAQLALSELAKVDPKHTARHMLDAGRIRRCATLLADCENASSISALVH